MKQRNAAHIKKYGVCLNDKCIKYKEIQEIVHGEFECPECGKKLSPCAPPKNKSILKPLYICSIIIVICIIVGGSIFFLNKGSNNEPKIVQTDSIASDNTINETNDSSKITEANIQNDTIKETSAQNTNNNQNKVVVNTAKTDKTNTSKSNGNGVLKLSFGEYTGSIKNGYPHGQGRLIYKTSRQINRNDMKARMANAGDYIIGEFFNGFVVYGKLYDAQGNLLSSLNFGVASENSFESK